MTGSGGHRPLRGRVRALRAGVLGTASLGLALGGHLAAGGHRPPLTLLGVCVGLLGLTAVTATARRVRLPLLLPLLGVQQVLLHLAFDAGAGAATCAAVDPHAGHVTGAVLSCAPGAASVSLPGWPMAFAHLVATLATAWLLLRGEQALWALAERVLRAAAAAPTALRRRAAVLRVPPRPAPVAVATFSPAAPRGPPVPVAP